MRKRRRLLAKHHPARSKTKRWLARKDEAYRGYDLDHTSSGASAGAARGGRGGSQRKDPGRKRRDWY
jgi:hypothetical protein